jgi:hypothetical protein
LNKKKSLKKKRQKKKNKTKMSRADHTVWTVSLDNIPEELENLLMLCTWGETEVAKANFLVQQWLIQHKQYHPTFPISSSLLKLRLNQEEIFKEFISYCQTSNNTIPRFSTIDPLQSIITDCDPVIAWRVLLLRMYGQNTSLVELFPNTMKVLHLLNESCPTIMFSVLEPFKNIPEHKGFYCGVLRYHLGLLVPPECSLTLDGKNYKWDPDIYFDDTFSHSVSNPTSKFRVVLFLDCIRDMKDERMNKINERIIQRIGDSTNVQEDIFRTNQCS